MLTTTMFSPWIEHARTIEGWMSEAELRWLAEQAKQHKCIAEIGSYLGRSTRALAETPGIVYAIDDWYGPRDVEWLTDEQRSTIHKNFIENMRGLNVIAVNSDHAGAEIPEEPDFVFIDGDHEYESVLRDIRRWMPRLAPGGLLAGHDAYKEGVDRAVRHTFGEIVIAPETTIWWTRKPSII